MRQRNHRHFIDFLFPLTLFLMFASLAVIIILLATNIYRETNQNSYYNDNARLSLTYVTEKIHQNNAEGRIQLTSMENLDVLSISHSGEQDLYYTYIYYKDGYIKELFIKAGTIPNFDFGRKIAPVSSFSIKEMTPQLLSFLCNDENQRTYHTIISLKCN